MVKSPYYVIHYIMRSHNLQFLYILKVLLKHIITVAVIVCLLLLSVRTILTGLYGVLVLVAC
jgi:hypothetical protein